MRDLAWHVAAVFYFHLKAKHLFKMRLFNVQCTHMAKSINATHLSVYWWWSMPLMEYVFYIYQITKKKNKETFIQFSIAIRRSIHHFFIFILKCLFSAKTKIKYRNYVYWKVIIWQFRSKSQFNAHLHRHFWHLECK